MNSQFTKNILKHRNTYGNSVTIVAIMKMEQLFLQEWLDHHIELGVRKFVLYNHDTSGYHISVPDGIEVQIIDYSMYHGLGQTVQIQAYNEACRNLKGEIVAAIDIDEFICISPEFQRKLDNQRPLLEAAFDYFGVDGLALSWMNMGADGKIKRPYGGVKENYAIPCPKVRKTLDFKSIYRVNQDILWKNAHRAEIKHRLYDTNRNVVTNITTEDLYDKIYIKHYITKSWEDYVAKLRRGNFTRGFRDIDTFFRYNPDMEHLRAKLTLGLNMSEFPTIRK